MSELTGLRSGNGFVILAPRLNRRIDLESTLSVIPEFFYRGSMIKDWIPAYAGMTIGMNPRLSLSAHFFSVGGELTGIAICPYRGNVGNAYPS